MKKLEVYVCTDMKNFSFLYSKDLENKSGLKQIIAHFIICQQTFYGKRLDRSKILKPVVCCSMGSHDLPCYTLAWLRENIRTRFEHRTIIKIFLRTFLLFKKIYKTMSGYKSYFIQV